MEDEQNKPLPAGDYAIVEVMGHRTYVGRITEVERFGGKFMSVEPIFQDELLVPVLIGAGSVYQFTPCDAETAARRQPKERWQLPAPVLATLPPVALPAPDEAAGGIVDDDGGPDDMPF